jgi:hypothetical protein
MIKNMEIVKCGFEKFTEREYNNLSKKAKHEIWKMYCSKCSYCKLIMEGK